MTEVIDSLKRLERVGSETSKTTQKLLEAAKNVSDLIVKQYNARTGETIALRFGGAEILNEEGDAVHSFHTYSIRPYLNTTAHGLYDEDTRRFVFENRDAGLHFAKDVANGLLEEVIESLATRKCQDEEALAALQRLLDPKRQPGAGKYAPLGQHLAAQTSSPVRLTLDQIETIISDALPEAARQYRAFWANNKEGHVHAAAWLDAGWTVESVDLRKDTVTFRRA